MSSNQDRSDVNYQPMWWLYGTSFALFVIGLFIVIVSFIPVFPGRGPTWKPLSYYYFPRSS